MRQQVPIQAPTPARVCGIYACPTHPTDACPTLQDNDPEFPAADHTVASIFPSKTQQQPPPRYDAYSNTYNPGWKDHPNLRYGNASSQQFQQQTRPFPQVQQNRQQFLQQVPTQPPRQQIQQQYLQQGASSTEPSLEDLMKQMATNNIQFQKNVNASIQDLQTQIGQLATTVNQLKSQGSGQIPSQPLINPKGNVSSITLRSGRELVANNLPQQASKKQDLEKKNRPAELDDAEPNSGSTTSPNSMDKPVENCAAITTCKI